jgi:PadR family transcriptional regulator, regulatory protein PadR
MSAVYNDLMPVPLQEIEVTPRIAAVLKVFLKEPQTARYGMELMRLTGQSSGTLYPNLTRLVKAGWLTVSKEDIDPRIEGRPARRNYTITGAAVGAARIELAALSEHYRPPALRAPRLAPHGGTE